MTSACYRVAVIFLVGLTVLPSAAARQTDDRKRPAHLYQVSVWDEKARREKFGFIDETGKLVIGFDRLPETTIAVGDFHEGRAGVVVRDADRKRPGGPVNKSGFIDETGKVVITPRFDQARDFSEGLAFAWGDGFLGYIDRDGREVFKVDSPWGGNFHEGLARTVSRETWPRRGGYIDRTGRLAIEGEYDFVDDFSEGLAGVVVGRRTGIQMYGFINRKGKMVIRPRFAPRRGNHFIVGTSRFSEGLACVSGAGSYRFIDKSGEYAFPQRFFDAQDFSEGLAWAMDFDRKSGWIDKTGQWAFTVEDGKPFAGGILAAARTSLEDSRFSEGLVPFVVLSGNNILRGYMGRKGEVVIRPMAINSAGPFVGGLARVTFREAAERREGVLGYIDRETGQFMEEKYGYIDRTGRFVWRAK